MSRASFELMPRVVDEMLEVRGRPSCRALGCGQVACQGPHLVHVTWWAIVRVTWWATAGGMFRASARSGQSSHMVGSSRWDVQNLIQFASHESRRGVEQIGCSGPYPGQVTGHTWWG